MKQPTLKQFTDKLDNLINNASADKLKELVISIAGETQTENRTFFLTKVEAIINGNVHDETGIDKPTISTEALFQKIEDYEKRMQEGEFFDEERDYIEYHKYEYSHRNNYDYYDDGFDMGSEEYVYEMTELLNGAGSFYSYGDFKTSLKAYQVIFNIIDDENYENDEYFIHGFSFSEALGEEVYKEHKIQFLRSFYLINYEERPDEVFQVFSKQRSLYLSNIVDADKKPLNDIALFLDGYINYLLSIPQKARHLVDVVYVKGGIEELKHYAYQYGNVVPALFLSWFTEFMEQNPQPDEIVKTALDGLEIIPEKYASRSILSQAITEIAKENNDKGLLLKAYSTAFYSNPELANLDSYLGLIMQNTDKEEIARFKKYLANRSEILSKRDAWPGTFTSSDIYSDETINILKVNYIVSYFIAFGLEDLLTYNDGSFLGFQNEKKHIPAILSLFLSSITTDEKPVLIEMLMDKYCFDNNRLASNNLRNLIYEKAREANHKVDNHQELLKAVNIAISRVRHILENKLRGGYESACLLLTASAEAKQLINNSGNNLIKEIDTEFKRFTAFRRELKALTKKSKVLLTVN